MLSKRLPLLLLAITVSAGAQTQTTPLALDTSLATAKEHRPELRQSTEQVRAARLTVDAARARLLPSVSVDFEGDLSGNRTTIFTGPAASPRTSASRFSAPTSTRTSPAPG